MSRRAAMPLLDQPAGLRLMLALALASGFVVFVALSGAARVLERLERQAVLVQAEAWAAPLLAELAAVPEESRDGWLAERPGRPAAIRALATLPTALARPLVELAPADRPPPIAVVVLPLMGEPAASLRIELDRPREAALFARALADARLCVLLAALATGLPLPLLLAWRRRHRPARPQPDRIDRAGFITALDAVLEAGLGEPSLILVELSGLDALADARGAEAATLLLGAALERLRGTARADDVLARLGPHRFGLLVEDGGLPDLPARIAERLVQALATPYGIGGQTVICGAHAGIAGGAGGATVAATLLAQAEAALAAALAQPSGSIHRYAPGEDAVRRSRGLEGALRQAAAAEAFHLHFQPMFGVADRRLLGFEALLRWSQPGGGPVSPTEFVPILEATGLILPVGAWVLRAACREATTWPGEIGVSVNLSPAQFRQDDLVATVRAALTESGLAPRRLTLEITEGLLLEHTDAVLDTLARLRALGCSIALDDFGSGHSSLAYLWRFHFDSLKIDRAFVRALGPAPGEAGKAAAIIETIVGLGRTLDLRITAEGVETEAQLAVIGGLGCDEVQGFLFGRPMPGPEARALADDPAAVGLVAE